MIRTAATLRRFFGRGCCAIDYLLGFGVHEHFFGVESQRLAQPIDQRIVTAATKKQKAAAGKDTGKPKPKKKTSRGK